MFISDGVLIYDANDLAAAMECEFSLLRTLDEVLHRVPALEVTDRMSERTARLAAAHHTQVRNQFRAQFEAELVHIDTPRERTLAALAIHSERTLNALTQEASAVTGGGLFDGRMSVRADFLTRAGACYSVAQATLARSAKPKAILGLAAFADQMQRAGVGVSGLHLHLGNGEMTDHDSADAVAVYRELRAHVQGLLKAHRAQDEPVSWGDERYSRCLWCRHCKAAIERTRDVRMVWGVRAHHREHLQVAGISTIDDLAAAREPAAGLSADTWQQLQGQAQLQIAQETADGDPPVVSRVIDRRVIDALPTPDPGDLFFDFEGDPLWVDSDRVWGLEYLFGMMTADGEYVTFWAHDRAEEKRALRDFLDYLRQRRRHYPQMRVYHYAAYEQYTLRALAARHHTGEDEVAQLLAAGVFVDLYEVVKSSVQVGQRSYSLKKLEPLYMGSEHREDDGVTDGGASVVAYQEASAMRERGDLEGYQQRLADLAEYNRYDCRSTWRLRDWLLAQTAGLVPDSAHAAQRSPKRANPQPRAAHPAALADQPASAEGLTSIGRIDGIASGLHDVRVAHRGRSRQSIEEAREVVAHVRSLLGRTMALGGAVESGSTVESGRTRALTSTDLLIVAAYSEQVQCISELGGAELADVRMGVIDQIGGHTAAVVICSVVASAPKDARRELAHLLAPLRWKAAIDAAGWATILVRSPGLTRNLPGQPEELAAVADFVRFTAPARPRQPRAWAQTSGAAGAPLPGARR